MASKVISFELQLYHYTGQTRTGPRATQIKVSEGSLMFYRCSRSDNGTEFVNQTLRAYYEDAEAIATACFTQNRPLIRKCHNKTPYELLHNKKLDLSYLHVFGVLCYPTNDSEDLGKLKPKADIGIFIGYALANKAFQIYNKRTRLITETIHVDFDELSAMAFEQFSSGPRPQLLTPGTLVLEVVAPDPNDSTGTPSSTTIDQDAPSPSTSQTPQETQSPSLVIPSGIEEHFHDIEVVHLDNDPFFGVLIPKPNSKKSSSREVIPANVHSVNQPLEHLRKWTKDHPLDNVIGSLSQPVSTRHQL
ncbi:integrase, catalytic region, zinc finger, CCHC-type containing protein [Tanacetum coccineum]